GGERVVGDLWPGRRERGDQRGLAGRGEADQAHVRDALELQHHLDRLAGLAELGEAGGFAAGVRRAALPRPPRPPRASSYDVPGPTRSASTSPARVWTT